MAWYDEAIFYHIYPLGLLDCPHENSYSEPVHRMKELRPWIKHIKDVGFNAIYIGPLFQSVGHGYETTDYKTVDSRLGDNKDLTDFVSSCHSQGIRVILDGVFNHTGRDFFAFKDIREKREASPYRDWYCNVNFGGNNSFGDGFSYENWGGHDLLVKLNQKNPAVRDYIADVIRFWVSEFDIDGIRLDAADVLDFDYMQMLRRVGDEVKPDFYLMGEVIHGDYIRWERDAGLHAVTNYHLRKALYSGHNDHNYFEIAHTVKRLYDMGGGDPLGLRLYNFADNHDVERISSILGNRSHFYPIHILMFTLPGVPSVYYGSEFGIEGKQGPHDDWAIRPAINLEDHRDDIKNNPCTVLIHALCEVRTSCRALSYGSYEQKLLTNRQYVFTRCFEGETAVVAVNNDEGPFHGGVDVPAGRYRALLSGRDIDASSGHFEFDIPASYGEIFVSENGSGSGKAPEPIAVTEMKMPEKPAKTRQEPGTTPTKQAAPEKDTVQQKAEVKEEATVAAKKETASPAKSGPGKKPAADNKNPIEPAMADKPYEEMSVEELQAGILYRMSLNGPVTDDMKRTVSENIWRDSLLNWIRSFG